MKSIISKIVFSSILFIISIIILFISGCTPGEKPILRIAEKVIHSDPVSVSIYKFENFKNFLEAKNDTTYIINFWATWCRPCVEELPYFAELYQKNKDTKLRFIFVSLDFEKEIEKKLLPFLKKNKLYGEVLVLSQKGMNNWIDQIEPSWSGSLPATLIYNQQGRDFYPGSFTFPELEKALKKRL